MKTYVQVSVKWLVEHLYRQGDITFNFGQLSRLSGLHGIRLHQKIQKSRPPSYDWEVGVSHRAESESVVLEIQGRIDGVYEKDGLIVIEEIKTTQRELDSYIDEQSSMHWAQVKIYAALFAMENNLDELITQLTFYQVETGEIKTFFQRFGREELEMFLHASIHSYMEWLERLESWRKERDRSISQSNFPYRSLREGQTEMILDVSSTIEQQTQLIMQAPTGIGKTVAALYPAIRALPAGHTRKIFYLTARTTGQKIAEKTLSELHSKGLKIKALTLTAKEKICFNPEKNCSGDDCLYASGYYDRLPEARKVIFKQDQFTMSDIAAIALENRLCPFEVSLELSLWVDCVICDFNYAFDPRVYLKRFFLNHPTDYTFLIDEAHNLVDRSREMFSAQIARSSFLKLRRRLNNKKAGLYKITGEIVKEFKSIEDKLGPEETSLWERDKPDDLLPLFKRFCHELERWIIAHPRSSHSEEWQEIYFTAGWFLNVADMYDKNYATCIEKDEHDLTLKLFCIDPSGQLRKALERAKSAVLFSATMTPVSYFAHFLGGQESISKRILPSPFPPQNLCLCVSTAIPTLYKRREATKDSLTRTLGTFIESKRGNYFIFFPSYEYMRMILPLYSKAYPHHDILVQRSGMTEEGKMDFLENFAHENSRTLVGFVVMGGIFGEGIDLTGDRLSGAAVVGVGLPGISLERELIKNHFENLNEPGFNYAYLYPGLNRVFQAAGRVIRTEKDQGAVLLIDSRYSLPQYRSLFPGEWHPRVVRSNTHMKQILNQFWRNNS